MEETRTTKDLPWCFTFHNVILAETICNNKLALSKEFIDKYGEKLSDFATLNVGDGAKPWKLGLHKTNVGMIGENGTDIIEKKIWIESGLNVFIKHYSIEVNDLLIFMYKGESKFDVLIHARESSCVKTRKPSQIGSPQNPRSKEQEQRQIGSAQYPRLQKQEEKKRKKGSCSNQNPECPSKKIKEQEQSKNHNSSDEDEFLEMLNAYPNIHVSKQHKTCFTAQAKTRAVLLVKRVEPQLPCFLAILLKSSLASASSCLTIGADFGRKFLSAAKKIRVQVSGRDDQNWEFNYLERSDGNGGYFVRGWKNFAENNELAQGDILLLVLICSKKDAASAVLKVFIDRSVSKSNQIPKCPPMKIKEEDESENHNSGEDEFLKLLENFPNIHVSKKNKANFTAEARTRAVSFIKKHGLKSKRPCYLAILQKSYSFSLVIGAEFSRKYLIGSKEVIFQFLDSDRQWCFNFVERYGGALITTGWRKFAEENKLGEGDVLILELNRSKKYYTSPVLQVFKIPSASK